jgi:metal-responsive CopG/Arc/MetJ family transcriptional regulator
MKTAVSIPDEVYEQAERFVRRTGRSRSDVYSRALAEYLARHAPDDVTDAVNRVVDELNEGEDRFIGTTARGTLGRTEW